VFINVHNFSMTKHKLFWLIHDKTKVREYLFHFLNKKGKKMSPFGHLFAVDLQFPFSSTMRSNTLRKSSPGHLLRSSRTAAAAAAAATDTTTTTSSCRRPIHCPFPALPFWVVRDGALRQRCAHHVHRPRQFAQRRRGGTAPGGGSSRAVRDPPGLLLLSPGKPFRLSPHSHIASWFLLGLGFSPPAVRSTGLLLQLLPTYFSGLLLRRRSSRRGDWLVGRMFACSPRCILRTVSTATGGIAAIRSESRYLFLNSKWLIDFHPTPTSENRSNIEALQFFWVAAFLILYITYMFNPIATSVRVIANSSLLNRGILLAGLKRSPELQHSYWLFPCHLFVE